MRLNTSTSNDAAQGAILGSLLGDAAGATLEFLRRAPTEAEIANALRLPGGGVLRVAPAQITDDGEMALALCHALAGASVYPLHKVARNYRAWYLSYPFDIGNTTANALRQGELDSPTLADEILARAQRLNMASQANGSLMRASGLGVWAARVSEQEAIDAARQDTRLTHPHPACQWSVAAYVVALRSLVLHPGDAALAHQAARQVVQAAVDTGVDSGASLVMGWLRAAERAELPDCTPQMGHVRIAFVYAFHHLIRQTPYVQALAHTLAGGGDTDTNACIVGGLVGALHGRKGLPGTMIQKLMACDTSLGHLRPGWLTTGEIGELIEKLLGLRD